ncbi:3776_t:CDS:2 [Ambispora gerdemannii]|uniref:3776_t:CDS:1 n=1 Tax=Ambispora gerdemannii TaxID=144530 RepID=A0A9N9A8S4_9GLOM|nr:3776_t:CDS:2 [Ambispora gerdemannii]
MTSTTLQKSPQVVGPKQVIHAISVDYPETGGDNNNNPKTKIMDGYNYGFVAAIHILDWKIYSKSDFGRFSRILDSYSRKFRDLSLDMDFWLDHLEPVIWKLVATYRGEIDEEFWIQVFLAMGGVSSTPDYWTGWISAFFPYDKHGNKIITYSIQTEGIPDGRVNVPFITDLGLDLSFSAGFLGARQELVGSGRDAEVYVSSLIG